MKINHKIIYLCLGAIVVLSLFPTTTLCQTTIANSTVSVEEGDFFSWKCTYTHPAYYGILGSGSYRNITVDTIRQGSFHMGVSIDYALILEVTEGRYIAGWSQHDEWQELYMVYNKTLNFLYMEDEINLIAPTPLNLTLIAETAGDCTISGNTITWNWNDDEYEEITFNPEGIMTLKKHMENGTTAYIFALEGEPGGTPTVSFGLYFAISGIGILFIVLLKTRKISR
jgi:hypothetical protein